MNSTTNNKSKNKEESPSPSEEVRIPEADIFVNEEEILLVADMPGIEKENLSINIEGNTLTITATRSDSFEGTPTRKEFSSQDFRRIFTLPSGLCIDETRAVLKRGLLYLHLPKSASVKPVRINVTEG